MCKIDRVAAWGLLFVMFTYFISGFGMTKGIIDPSIATNLHNNLLPILGLIFFTIHSFYAIRLSFMRWKIWNIFSKIFLILFYLIFVLGFLYVDLIYIYKPKTESVSAITNQDQTTQIDNTTSIITKDTTTNVSNTQTEKYYTTDELAQYDGKNDQPAYLAIDGTVYDLTSVFVNGYHYGHPAGVDLTDAFYSRHVKSSITKYPVVGTLK